MSEQIKSLKVKDIFNSEKGKYKIPIYQRNYAWKEPQIRQLIQDIYDYYLKDNRENENEIKKYYIGTLVVRPDKEKNTFEVIDGQQRLTTLSMLVAYLNSVVKGQDNTQESVKSELKNTITFQCRQVSTNFLNKIWEAQSDDCDATDSITAGYQILKKSFEDIVKKETVEGYLNYLRENVIVYRISVPKDTDLNHYFEIMNTRGEQLEKHEILKAELLSVFKDNTGTREFYSGIWDACSDMGKYVCPEALLPRSQDKKQDSNDQENKEENFTIKGIIENADCESRSNNGQNNSIEDRYRSIIDFPNFLLMVLKLMDDKTVLDDKKLLYEFDKKLKFKSANEIQLFVKEFFKKLLVTRFLFDNYVIKRELASGKWILKFLKVNAKVNAKGEKKEIRELNNTFDDEKNKQILMLLSMFEVSYPNYSYKTWLFETLKYLTGKAQPQNCNLWYNIFCINFKDCLPAWNMVDADDYINHLEQYANKKRCEYGEYVCPVNVDNLNKFDKMACSIEEQRCDTVNLENFDAFDKGTAVPNFIFNLLDYKLWKKGKDKDFEFTYRDSVEHFYPQNPISGKSVENVDSFGNLCLITSEMNSRLNNLPPSAKKEIWKKSKSQQSIKLSKMLEIEDWNENAIKNHKAKMLEVLFAKETSEH